jgi:hypothetical protein
LRSNSTVVIESQDAIESKSALFQTLREKPGQQIFFAEHMSQTLCPTFLYSLYFTLPPFSSSALTIWARFAERARFYLPRREKAHAGVAPTRRAMNRNARLP